MTKTFTTDNRWSAGGLDAKVPDTAVAVYGARWIDHGTWADIVPDRQGFAYSEMTDRDKLVEQLVHWDAHRNLLPNDRETEVRVVDDKAIGFQMWMRRSGGYVYVCAWLEDF